MQLSAYLLQLCLLLSYSTPFGAMPAGLGKNLFQVEFTGRNGSVRHSIKLGDEYGYQENP